jgi:preprotein translocase subunit SecE
MNVMNIKLVLSFLLLIAGLGGFYILFDHPLVFRILSVLVGFVAATYVFSTTSQGDRLLKFIKEAITEAKKVVWPTRKETIQMTLVVFVLAVIMAIFLAFVDIFFSYVINILLGRGS